MRAARVAGADLWQAAAELEFDPAAAFVVGDKESDVETARDARSQRALLRQL